MHCFLISQKLAICPITKLSIIAPYIYDARHHAHPYILSTTVLSDTVVVWCLSRQNSFQFQYTGHLEQRQLSRTAKSHDTNFPPTSQKWLFFTFQLTYYTPWHWTAFRLCYAMHKSERRGLIGHHLKCWQKRRSVSTLHIPRCLLYTKLR